MCVRGVARVGNGVLLESLCNKHPSSSSSSILLSQVNPPLYIYFFDKLSLKNEALCDFPMKKIPGTCRSGTGTAPCGTSRF
eukprot:SAG11_NODE_28956_length_315_cov_204.694444_1_plen_80_part_10